MRLCTLLLLTVPAIYSCRAQGAAFPLESLAIEGSTVPQAAIRQITGLVIATPIDKAGIEAACQKLQESGLFSSISYRYAPGPKNGYAVTLLLADQAPLIPATIDVPGTDEQEAWQWLKARYSRFDREVPQLDIAHQFLAKELEGHIGTRMRGQRLTARMETDLRTGTLAVSFQPEVLPRVRAVTFSGNQTIPSPELMAVLDKSAAGAEYTHRKFSSAVDLNLRPVYEERGLYRVQFTPGMPEISESGVALQVAVSEGPPYQLGKVEIVGADPATSATASTVKFPTGSLANWKQIQSSIWEVEKVIKRSGYMQAVARADRSYDDGARLLHLRIQIAKGPLHRWGGVRFTGLTPDQESRAKRLWKAQPGEPYNYEYPNDFLRAFSQEVDFRQFRKFNSASQTGPDHVVSINLIFETR